jgi:hypothetical protein
MCAKRYGKLGLKTIASQSTGKAMPSRISWPAGVCIQLLAERIQNADIAVPTATATAEKHVQPGRHAVPAEQQDAEKRRLEEEGGQHLVADQRADHIARDMREAAPVGAELVGQHDPDTTPIAKETAKILVQNRASV